MNLTVDRFHHLPQEFFIELFGAAFEAATKAAYRQSIPKAAPQLLEPIMKLEVITPDSYTGDIVGDLNRRRGIMEGMQMKGGSQVIKAKVPLSEMFGYVTQLRTLSSGRATSTMEFDSFAPAPNSVATEVIEKASGKVKVD